MKGENLITAIVTSNSILILALTALFIRERSRRKALEVLLRQSINYWRNAHEANLKTKIEARRQGHSVTEQRLDDGSVKLTVSVGGEA